MKVETFIGAILSKMSDITKCQLKFIPHIMRLFLSIRGRLNYLNLERHGDYGCAAAVCRVGLCVGAFA